MAVEGFGRLVKLLMLIANFIIFVSSLESILFVNGIHQSKFEFGSNPALLSESIRLI